MLYWIWLTQIPSVGAVTARKLIQKFGNAENVYQADERILEEISGLPVHQQKRIIQFRSLEAAKEILDNCEKNNISVLCWNDERYPMCAKEPEDAPVLLYYKGHFESKRLNLG